MSSDCLPSRSSATHRGTSRTEQSNNNTINSPGSNPGPGLPAAPSPRPIFQLLAFVLFLALGFLQFLPATHFRHPSDPRRNWFPFHSYTPSPLREFESGTLRHDEYSGEDGMVHVVSWMDCLDLTVLAVLVNSTLSSSSHPDRVFFHFFIPGGNTDRVSFYKLKVLFPDSNLEIQGQEEVKELASTAFSGLQYAEPKFEEIAPFVLPSVHKFLSKFIYVSPNVIMKARIEELVGIDLGYYAIATAEDCSERLSTYVNSDVLDAIQRSASKPWVSKTPYAKDACLPDLNVLLIKARKLEKDFVDAVLWWSKVLNLGERSGRKSPAVALALYDRYLKLSSSWLVKDSTSSEIENSKVILYDGPKTVCTESSGGSI